ncbi:MAG: MaoC family dehydratase [Acidimicrobiales bacterium]
MTPPTRYFDDLAAGDRFEIGSFRLTASEIVEFARRYDPQPFHTDPEAAASSIFGGLIASGWQTGASVMRLMVDNFISTESGLGSPGMDEIRWIQPVRPDIEYSASVTVEQTKASASKPDRGVIWSLIELRDPDGQVVYSSRGMGMWRRRP